jgi:hypothetical protein
MCSARLQSIPGVVRVNNADTRESAPAFEVDSEKGADIRSAVANAIVRGGWGLLELRPMRMSLEDIFLSLTTEKPTIRWNPWNVRKRWNRDRRRPCVTLLPSRNAS